MADRSNLRLGTLFNTRLQIEPPLDALIAKYKNILSTGGTIGSGVKVVVGITERGPAMVTALPEVPEVLEKNVKEWRSSTNVEMSL